MYFNQLLEITYFISTLLPLYITLYTPPFLLVGNRQVLAAPMVGARRPHARGSRYYREERPNHETKRAQPARELRLKGGGRGDAESDEDGGGEAYHEGPPG